MIFQRMYVYFFLLICATPNILAQPSLPIPVIENGLAQVIPELENPELWIREDLWVETEFDSDGDGRLDRMHVAVT